MKQYPLPFKVSASSPAGIQTNWSATAQAWGYSVPLSIPPEFDGPGQGLSPEDIYAMALQNCYIATFKVFAEKSRLQYDKISVETLLEVDRDEKGRPWMARAHFQVTLNGAQQKENALRIMEKTSQSCMILNSVNTAKSFDYRLVD